MVNDQQSDIPTDIHLVELSLKKDQIAYKTLVQRYIDRIYHFAKTYNLANDEAEDITQETFIKAWKKLHTFDQTQKFQSWIYTIARNTILDQIRKNKTLPFSYFEDEDNLTNFIESTADTQLLASEIFDNSQRSTQLKIALKELNEIEKTIIILHYEEEFTFEEISSILKKPMNTVKSLHRRSLLKLKSKLDKLG